MIANMAHAERELAKSSKHGAWLLSHKGTQKVPICEYHPRVFGVFGPAQAERWGEAEAGKLRKKFSRSSIRSTADNDHDSSSGGHLRHVCWDTHRPPPPGEPGG